MSSDSLSHGSWDFLGLGTGREERQANQREESIGEELPAESIYQEVFEEIHGESDPASNPWRQSLEDVNIESYLRDIKHSRTASPHRNKHSTPITTRSSYLTSESQEVVVFDSHQARPSNAINGFSRPVYPKDPLEGHINDSSAREHPLYQKATPGPDGLYHCPWEGKDPSCNHKPEKLKCNYDKFVDSHLKPYRCNVHACENARFSSTACLLRHEREAHAMHGHGEKPFLCTFDGCERGVPGNGFPRHWNLCDHMKRVHNRSISPSPAMSSPARASGRRKRSQNASPLEGLRRDRAVEPGREGDRLFWNPTETAPATREVYDYKFDYNPKLSLAQTQFRDKTEELIATIRKIRNVEDKDALRNLHAVEDCLKFLTSEVMKTKVGPGGLASKGDVEMPD